ncbi:MAG: outer membrane lipoprotein-sorting protein, partial [Helicobacteraceae bacterium]|nr:outer membrane lipoprotein-sorting protein [Helicobacteraceae bacterium]
MRKLLRALAVCAALFSALFGDDKAAREIMEKVDARNEGDRMTADMEMILIDKNKDRRVRSLRQFRRDEGEDSYKLIFFLEPSDVRNTGFLTYDYDDPDKDDDQWLYLPALKKSKRIASSDKSSSFMGSDFSYGDMASRELDDYDFKLIEEREVNGRKVWVIECVPRTKKVIDESGYTKSLLLVRQDNFVIVRAVHYEKKQGRIKLMDITKLEQIDGIWQPLEIQMTSKQGAETLHGTILRF